MVKLEQLIQFCILFPPHVILYLEHYNFFVDITTDTDSIIWAIINLSLIEEYIGSFPGFDKIN